MKLLYKAYVPPLELRKAGYTRLCSRLSVDCPARGLSFLSAPVPDADWLHIRNLQLLLHQICCLGADSFRLLSSFGQPFKRLPSLLRRSYSSALPTTGRRHNGARFHRAKRPSPSHRTRCCFLRGGAESARSAGGERGGETRGCGQERGHRGCVPRGRLESE